MKDSITLDSILNEIEQVRELALSVDDYKTALNCTMSKAKLLGIDRPTIAKNDAVQQISDLIDELSNDATG